MLLSPLSIEEQQASDLAVDTACRRIPPLWPLQNFVAVNPFLGLGDMPFEEAARLLGKVTHSSILMSSAYYLNQIQNGTISSRDVQAAVAELGIAVRPSDPVAWLREELQQTEREARILTVADWLDQSRGTSWAPFVVDEISKWCASYFDRGQSAWAMPWTELPLYQAWKQIASIDANPEVFGLADFRQQVKALPDSEDAAIELALERLQVPTHLTAEFLHRELVTIFGWSAYAAYHDRQAPGHRNLPQMLAIRLAYDTALLTVDPQWRCEVMEPAATSGFSEAKYVAQLALEHALRSGLVKKLRTARPRPLPASRKALQAIFCIDVRSEVFRRALEAQSADIETIGFAGFFGMSVEFAGTARCPVLLTPRHKVHATASGGESNAFGDRAAAAWKSLSASASTCFSAVEVGGAWFGARLVQQFTRKARKTDPAKDLAWHIPLSERVDLATGALKNMSVEASRLAPIVLICGHGSSTENNPYGSSLDCGACGGHKGDINARFAAALMNDPAVREGLRERGIVIPQDTVFLAGLHITTTDDVVLYDSEQLLTAVQRTEIEGWLHAASRQARSERSQSLMLCSPPASVDELDRELRRRSADWSEVRPEWGLAGNAAFIAAPRSRTRDLDLGGRVFLHEYDATADHDGSVLQLILTAPVIVASWINLQYYGSTVNNQLFGSGNKVLHNVVGTFGVWEGNGGDLRTGLPLQSLHDGAKWMHEPVRLQVFVEASRERIDKVLRANPDIRNLVENQWIHLMAMDGDAVFECRRPGSWHLSAKENK